MFESVWWKETGPRVIRYTGLQGRGGWVMFSDSGGGGGGLQGGGGVCGSEGGVFRVSGYSDCESRV